MGFLSSLFGALLGSGGGSSDGRGKKRYRQDTGRYGKKGTYRKERNGDRVGRDSKTGKYKK